MLKQHQMFMQTQNDQVTRIISEKHSTQRQDNIDIRWTMIKMLKFDEVSYKLIGVLQCGKYSATISECGISETDVKEKIKKSLNAEFHRLRFLITG